MGKSAKLAESSSITYITARNFLSFIFWNKMLTLLVQLLRQVGKYCHQELYVLGCWESMSTKQFSGCKKVGRGI